MVFLHDPPKNFVVRSLEDSKRERSSMLQLKMAAFTFLAYSKLLN